MLNRIKTVDAVQRGLRDLREIFRRIPTELSDHRKF